MEDNTSGATPEVPDKKELLEDYSRDPKVVRKKLREGIMI